MEMCSESFFIMEQSPTGNHQEVILNQFVERPPKYYPLHDTTDLAQLPEMHVHSYSLYAHMLHTAWSQN